MLKHRHVFSCFLFITIKLILADNDNLQDFCPTDIPTWNDCHHKIFINGYPCKNPANITASDFKTSKLKFAGDTDNFIRSHTSIVTASEFPGLNTLGLALGRTDLDTFGIVSPHSHPRASEMMFLTKGEVNVVFIDTKSQVFEKVLKEGEVFIVPKGMLHYCYNSGFEFATILSVHNSQNPGLMDLSGSMSGSEAVGKIKRKLEALSKSEVSGHHSEL